MLFKKKKTPPKSYKPPFETVSPPNQGGQNGAKKPAKKSLGNVLFRYIVAPVLIVILSFHLIVAGMLAMWGVSPVNNSMFMLAHRLTGEEVRQEWVDYDKIAKSAKQAAIASEDAKFATHNGFDLEGIERAIKANEAEGAVSMGGSTITQQLAKNLFLTSHRSYIRKAEEAVITVMIEQMWTKTRILEVYLNVAEFGSGIYGIEAASRHYFKKSAKNLNNEQAALLISMLPNPKFFQKNIKNKRLQNKKRIIMRRMPSAALPK